MKTTTSVKKTDGMKIFKRILLILGIVVFLILGTAIVVPLIFKDDLMRFAKQEINKNLHAVVEFEDVRMSLLRDFPDLYFSIEDFSVTGTGQFEGVRLVSGESVALTLDLLSILSNRRPSQLKAVSLERPDIQVYILKDGTANYDIVKTMKPPPILRCNSRITASVEATCFTTTGAPIPTYK
jgi:uncharacterized protein involved in outer membrane biogenesis